MEINTEQKARKLVPNKKAYLYFEKIRKICENKSQTLTNMAFNIR